MKLGGYEIGQRAPLFLIAGPCVIESEALALSTAEQLQEITAKLGVPLHFQGIVRQGEPLGADRVPGARNRSRAQGAGARAPGVRVPVLTDVHEDTPLAEVADVVDVLQTPAFLCRQTNFVLGVARQGKPVNLKKGQFLSPWEMRHVVDKARSTGNSDLTVCERGVSFGYNNLVVDMRSLAILRETGCPVVFDASHSVQQPGSLGSSSGGEREHIPVLARAAVAAGIAGLYLETHPRPEDALSDGPSAWPLRLLAPLLEQLRDIDALVKEKPFLETEFSKSLQESA